jgi:hypothetical protein
MCASPVVSNFDPPQSHPLPTTKAPVLPDGIHQCNDARVWAKAFVDHVLWTPTIATDEGTMIGWFANAMMAMHNEMNRRSHPLPPAEAHDGAARVEDDDTPQARKVLEAVQSSDKQDDGYWESRCSDAEEAARTAIQDRDAVRRELNARGKVVIRCPVCGNQHNALFCYSSCAETKLNHMCDECLEKIKAELAAERECP